MAKMKKDEIVAAVYEWIADAEGYETDELAHMRKEALDYYYNRESVAPHMDGRSKLQSSDISDMVEAVTSQIMPAFDMDDIVEFEPISDEDVDQARLESNACNWVVMEQNNGFYELQQAVRDALLLRNGIVKVYPDERIDTDVQYFDTLTEMQYNQLMSRAVGSLKSVDNGHTVELLKEKDGFYDVRVTTKTTERKICTEAVDPANFSWERDHDSIYLNEIRFCAERSLPTRSELIEMGYQKSLVNSLNYGGNDTQIDALARNQNSTRRNWQGKTPAGDIIEVYECYCRLDADGDGVSELLRVVVASKKILEIEEVPYIPYACGTAFLQPHRFTGQGLYDRLRFLQDQKTFGLRQWADNLNNNNNSRVIALEGQVNYSDITNSRPGGVVRATSPDAVVPFPVTDVGPSALSLLEYTDKMRSERGGASLDMQSAEMQIAGETAHGIERQISAKEQLAAHMTRTLSETLIRTLYQLVHKAMRMYVPDELQFRQNGQFKQVNPAEWPERKTVNVKAGLSMAERMAKSGALSTIVQHQMTLIQNGHDGTMVDQAGLYNAAIDWARCQSIKNPERYFIDPNSEQGQMAAQQKQQQAAAQQQQQQMLFDAQMEIEQRNAEREEAKIIEDGRQFDEELRFKYWQEQQKTNVATGQLSGQLFGNMMGQNGQDKASGKAGNESTTDRAN